MSPATTDSIDQSRVSRRIIIMLVIVLTFYPRHHIEAQMFGPHRVLRFDGKGQKDINCM